MKRRSVTLVAMLAAQHAVVERFRRRQKDPRTTPMRSATAMSARASTSTPWRRKSPSASSWRRKWSARPRSSTIPIIAEYVNRVGQNLVRNSDAKVPFTIKVLDTEEVNAFALPGGFFFVNSGLILKADTEAELAGVMAHEIAHVAARHGTRQATKGAAHPTRHHSADLHGRLDRVRHPAGRRRCHPHGLPALLAAPWSAKPITWACSTCTSPGYDPTGVRGLLRKDSSPWKRRSPAPWPRSSPRTRMTDDRIKAAQDEIQKILTAEAGIRRQYLRIQRREGSPGDAAQPPQGGYNADPNRPTPAPRSRQRHRSRGSRTTTAPSRRPIRTSVPR